MSAQTSRPAPRLTASQAQDLRADLQDSGWGVAAVTDLLGPAVEASLHREQRLPALSVLRRVLGRAREQHQIPQPLAVLTAVFMLGEEVPDEELDAALPRTRSHGARAVGLVEPVPASGRSSSGPTLVRAAVDLRPHEAVDDAGQVRWWVASDLGELTTGRALAPDHVLGIGGAGLTLAGLVPREPVRRALDLGCGCGIQTLYLLRHAEHVTATDISERALAFTAFNTALAGTDPERLELRAGSFLEPVAGHRFDLVVTNPPFVITPPAVREAGLPLMEYRDAGRPVLPTLVPDLDKHLEPGGLAVMLGNWEHHHGQDWQERVSSWLPPEADSWVIQREVQDPVEYATMWLRDGGSSPERDEPGFAAALDAWLGDFQARGVEEVGFGYLILHRPDPQAEGGHRTPWRVLEEVTTTGTGPLGPHVSRVLKTRCLVQGLDDETVAGLRLRTSPDVTEERHFVPGAAEPSVILIRQGQGFGRTRRAGTAMTALVEVSDGELSVAQVAGALAALTELTEPDARALHDELVSAARELLFQGFLLLGESPGQPG